MRATIRKLRFGEEEIGIGSRKGFQLVERKPSSLTLGGFNSVPVWGHNHDNDVGVGGKIGHVCRRTKWRSFQRRARYFDPSLHLMTERIHSLLEILCRRLGCGEASR